MATTVPEALASRRRGDAMAIVLAGGSGRRLGSAAAGDKAPVDRSPVDKAAVELAGRTLLDRVVTAVAGEVDGVIVVTAPGRPPPACRVPVEIVPDSRPGAGPLAGLADGLRHARQRQPACRRAIVVSCDLPLLRPALLGMLLDRVAEPGRRWVVPVVGGHPQPLVSALAIDCLAEVEARLATGAHDLRGLLADLRHTGPAAVLELGEDDLRRLDPGLDSFRDVDTPADLRAAVSRLQSASPG